MHTVHHIEPARGKYTLIHLRKNVTFLEIGVSQMVKAALGPKFKVDTLITLPTHPD